MSEHPTTMERRYSLAELAAMKLPLERGRKTLWHWVTQGVKINGVKKYLKTTRINRGHYTTLSELQAFIGEMQVHKADDNETP